MKKLTLLLTACLTLLALTLPSTASASNCDQELTQCIADCASFGNPTINGQSCQSVCVFYYRRCEETGGHYCPGYGTGSGCYEME